MLLRKRGQRVDQHGPGKHRLAVAQAIAVVNAGVRVVIVRIAVDDIVFHFRRRLVGPHHKIIIHAAQGGVVGGRERDNPVRRLHIIVERLQESIKHAGLARARQKRARPQDVEAFRQASRNLVRGQIIVQPHTGAGRVPVRDGKLR